MTAEPATQLEYVGPVPRARVSRLTVVAFVASLVSSPPVLFSLLTSGLVPLERLPNSVPPIMTLALPMLTATALGVVSYIRVRRSKGMLSGRRLALAAILFCCLWWVIALAAVYVLWNARGMG